MPFESGRRLCLLFEAGLSRYAVEATSVVEVAPVSPTDAQAEKLRGVFELRDLAVLLGGAPEPSGGLAVVLDVSPTLALRVRQVVEVADVARAPFFHLPPGLGERLGLLVRGALLHKGTLYLELNAEALVHAAVGPVAPPARSLFTLPSPPERALVFESQAGCYGLPLPWVLQIVSGQAAFCPLPVATGPVAGLLAQSDALWPVYSIAGLLGGSPRREALFVLSELAGQQVALSAERMLGVHGPFAPSTHPGEFTARGLEAAALFLDFQRMFS